MEKKIKIFVDAHSFDTGYQGTQTFIEGLYTTLMKDYPDMDIYFGCCDKNKIARSFPLIDPGKIFIYKKRSLPALRMLTDIPGILKKHGFDFAHFQYIAPAADKHCKYIVTLHDILFNDFPKEFSPAYRKKRNFLFKRSLKNADIKTTVSDYSRKRIHEHYKIPDKKIHIIPNAASLPVVAKVSKSEAVSLLKEKYGIENFILYVSRIEPRKNHLLLLNTFIELELYKQGIQLVFIGKRSIACKALEQRIASLTKKQQAFFYFIEEVETEELQLFYGACRLFVYPSKAEGFGIPPLEAAINKAPVLCSNVTSMSEFDFFQPNDFDPADTIVFKQKLKVLIDLPPSYQDLEDISIAVNKKYSWKKSAATFYSLLKCYTEK
jgi:glycosyltransferase involved in cell wall biosynthesis